MEDKIPVIANDITKEIVYKEVNRVYIAGESLGDVLSKLKNTIANAEEEIRSLSDNLENLTNRYNDLVDAFKKTSISTKLQLLELQEEQKWVNY